MSTDAKRPMAANGVDLIAQIHAYEPDEACRGELEAERTRLLGAVLAAFKVDT